MNTSAPDYTPDKGERMGRIMGLYHEGEGMINLPSLNRHHPSEIELEIILSVATDIAHERVPVVAPPGAIGNRPWGGADVKELKVRYREAASIEAIARDLGRTPAAILSRFSLFSEDERASLRSARRRAKHAMKGKRYA